MITNTSHQGRKQPSKANISKNVIFVDVKIPYLREPDEHSGSKDASIALRNLSMLVICQDVARLE